MPALGVLPAVRKGDQSGDGATFGPHRVERARFVFQIVEKLRGLRFQLFHPEIAGFDCVDGKGAVEARFPLGRGEQLPSLPNR